MNEDKNREYETKGTTSQVPQVIYSYPFPGSQDDEIDLGSLLANLLAQYKLILGITVLGTLLSVAVALWLPNIYQKEVILSEPSAADIVSLNSNGYTTYTPRSIFKEYYDELRSPRQFGNYVTESGLLEEIFPDKAETEAKLIAELREEFIINVLEPQPETKGAQVISPSRLSVKLTGEQEQAITNFLNGYVSHIEKLKISELVSQQKKQINNELADIERKISLLRSAELKARENEIARREESNNEELASLQNQIEALLSKSALDKTHELVGIEEAHAIAKRLKITKPTTITNIGKSSDEPGGNKTEINLTDWQGLPMYLMGTEYLDAKREEILARKDDIPFIKEYSSLIQKIKLIQNDAELAALKARKTDDPYIKELPALINRKDELQKMKLDFSNTNLVRIDKSASVTGVKVKPKRSLIVIGGAFLSGFLALVLAIIALMISGRKD